jgi:hypothetical protein
VEGIDPPEKEKGFWTTNIKVERAVDTGWLIVISALKVDVEPGALELKVFRILTAIRLLIGRLFTTAPKFELASYINPLELMEYISMLGEIFCIFGITLYR